MEKIQPGTADGTEENIQKIAALFPEVMTEVADADGTPRHVVDYDALHELLGDGAEGQRERYQFTWPGKAEAKAEARRPVWKTMRPEPDKSVNWDTTKNLYIEGDNLDALKILKETYAGRVKLIYIDPPYNTGHDFVYDDDFAQTHEEYDAVSGDYDGDGGRLVANPDSNGRFHSDWCSMIYPRLVLARDLLSADGAIFISIDSNELTNLNCICREIFGATNFVAQLTWEKKKKGAFLSKNYINMTEYILVYAKNISVFNGLVGEVNHEPETYPCIKTTNARGVRVIHKGTPCKARSRTFTIQPNTRYSSGNMELIYLDKAEIVDGILVNDVSVDSNWIYGQEKLDTFSQKGEIYITQDCYIRRIVNDDRIKMLKDLLSRVGADGKALMRYSYDDNLNNGGWGTNEDANDELHKLLGTQNVFDFSKPTRLIGKLIQCINDSDAFIVDFFSGSATTAEAVMRVNAADGGTRRCVLVQFPEECPSDSVAGKAGYKTICDIGEERIRRAGAKIRAEVEEANRQLKLGEEPRPVPDVGFRVLRIDSSNMEDTYRTPGETDQMDLLSLADNVKLDRTPEDLLFEVLPKFRIPYSARIERRELGGRECFLVDGNRLIACFDAEVGTETIEEMAKLEPDYAVMRDASMKDDATQANFEELFKTYSPDTVRRVI